MKEIEIIEVTRLPRAVILVKEDDEKLRIYEKFKEKGYSGTFNDFLIDYNNSNIKWSNISW